MAPPLFLEKGSRGKFVRAFQAGLNVRRQFHPLSDALPPLAEDGVMGPATIARAALLLEKPGAIRFSRSDLGEAGVNVALLSDLSGHNEGGNKRLADLDRAARDGVYGSWFKQTEGRSYVNTEAKRQCAAAKGVMKRGGYHFADPSVSHASFDLADIQADANAEAWHYLRTRRDQLEAPELPDLIDFERGISRRLGRKLLALAWTSPKKHEANALWALTILDTIEQATGRKPWIYLPLWAFNAYFRRAPAELLKRLMSHKNLVPSYNAGAGPARIPPGSEDWGGWQFTATGRVDGIDGDVDLSWALLEDLAQ